MRKKTEFKLNIFNDMPIESTIFMRPEQEAYAVKIAEIIKRSFEEGYVKRIIGIIGPVGIGKTSLFKFAVHHLPKWQEMQFHPTFYENETEIAAAFVRSALNQIQIEASGLSRLRVKVQLWWHNLNLSGGMVDLFKQVYILVLRLIVFVGIPIVLISFIPIEVLDTVKLEIVAALGGSVVFLYLLRQAFKPGLNLDPDRFIRRIQMTATTNSVEDYVNEFRWIANLARSIEKPLVILVDPIDDGLPYQTALLLETLRLFSTIDMPCCFVFISDDLTSLRTVVRARFTSQMDINSDKETLENLKKMADVYLRKNITLFELAPAPEIKQRGISNQ